MVARANKPNPGATYQEGRRAFAAGRYGLAIRAWKPIAALPAMRPVLAEAYLRRGLEQKADGDLEQALQLSPGDDRPLRALVALLIQRRDVPGVQRALARYGGGLPQLAEVAAACSGTAPKDGRKKNLMLLAELSSGDGLPDPRRWPAGLRPLAEAAASLLHGGKPPASSSRLSERDPLAQMEALLRTAAWLDVGEVPAASLASGLQPSTVADLRPVERAVVRRLTATLALRGEVSAAEDLLQRFPDAFKAQESAAVQVRIGAVHYEARRFAHAAKALIAARGAYRVEQAIALACEGAGDDAGALEAWRRVLRQEERLLRGDDRAALAKVHLRIAHLAWLEEDFRTAARHFQAGLAGGEPEDPAMLQEYAQCLDELGQEDQALAIYLRYLLRVPGDTGTLDDLVNNLMQRRAHDTVLQIAETMAEMPAGNASALLLSALAFIAHDSLMDDDEPERMRRAHAQLMRLPAAAALAQRTGAILLARAGRMEQADAMLQHAQPLDGDKMLLEWSRLVDGVARLRVGRLDEAKAAFSQVLAGNRFRIAIAYCLMHAERTGEASCAGSAEGREMAGILATVAESDPVSLLHDAPRRARRCPHFSATLGNLRASVDPERMRSPMHSKDNRAIERLLRAMAVSIHGDDEDDGEGEDDESY